LARLQVPDLPGLELAVVVVDNSADASAERQVSRAGAAMPMPLHYLSEPRRGITYARNAALEKATSLGCDFVAFIDDDEVPASRWLSALLAAQGRSGATAVVGDVRPLLPPQAPAWIAAGGSSRPRSSLTAPR
jgi:succinoglycan biosynthesis protein ExoM